MRKRHKIMVGNFIAITVGFYAITAVVMLLFVTALLSMGASFGDTDGRAKLITALSQRQFWIGMSMVAFLGYAMIASQVTLVGWRVQRKLARFFGRGNTFVTRKVRLGEFPFSIVD